MFLHCNQNAKGVKSNAMSDQQRNCTYCAELWRETLVYVRRYIISHMIEDTQWRFGLVIFNFLACRYQIQQILLAVHSDEMSNSQIYFIWEQISRTVWLKFSFF